MKFKSNLTAPDLTPCFPRMQSKVRPWSFGHDVPSDMDFEPDCCSLTHDEAAILYHCAKSARGMWCDIGARFGWTAMHINHATKTFVDCVDPAFRVPSFRWRFLLNTEFQPGWVFPMDAFSFFHRVPPLKFSGSMIDGNHDSPEPLNDAMNAAKCAAQTCCIVFHDFWGEPIRDAVRWLMDNGWNARVYYTPNGMAVCWRGTFTPPDHQPDPYIRTQQTPDKFPDFDFARLK